VMAPRSIDPEYEPFGPPDLRTKFRIRLLAAAIALPFTPLVAAPGQCWVTPLLDGTSIVEVPFGAMSCAAPIPAATASVFVDDPGVAKAVLAPGSITLTIKPGYTIVRLRDSAGAEIEQLQVTKDVYPVPQGLFTCASVSPPTC
jgi:hypothetical protein